MLLLVVAQFAERDADVQILALSVMTLFGGVALSRLIGAKQTSFPLMTLVIFYHLLAFVWPHVNGLGDAMQTITNQMTSLSYTAIGLLGLILGEALSRRLPDRVEQFLRHGIERHAINSHRQWFLAGMILWGLGVIGTTFLKDVTALVQLFGLMHQFGFVCALASALVDGVALTIRVTVLVLFAFELAITLSSGSLAQPVFLLVLVLCLRRYFLAGDKSPRVRAVNAVLIVAGLVIAILFQSVKGEFRRQFWDQSISATPLEKVVRFGELVYERLLHGDDEAGDLADQFQRRASNAAALAVVIDMTPSIVPYQHGATMIPLFYGWIPRLVWPTKPESTLGNDWAKPYALLGSGDNTTSYNLPWLIEFYMNFGVWGIFLGMCVVGYGVGIVERVFFSVRALPYTVIVGFTLFSQIWWMESNISLILGNLGMQVIVIVAVSYIFQQLLRNGIRTSRPGVSANGGLK